MMDVETMAQKTDDTEGTEGVARAAGRTPGRRRCVRCGAPMRARWQPFCSKRCADLDLGQWLSEGYRIPVDTGLESEDETVPDEDPSDDR